MDLKKNFDKIKLINTDISNIFDNLQTKINKLTEIYNSFLNENKSAIFIFGLDSFKFQNKLFQEEYSSLIKYYNLICNRIYCDYYKLNIMIIDNILNNKSLSKIHKLLDKNKFEKYNYLDVYKYYNIGISFELFSEIVNLITLINDESKSMINIIKSYNNKKQFGLNINNFIYSYTYENSILNEQISLYIKYISFFIKAHIKYLSRFFYKLKILNNEINKDISFDMKQNINNINSTTNLSNMTMNNIESPFSFSSEISENNNIDIEDINNLTQNTVYIDDLSNILDTKTSIHTTFSNYKNKNNNDNNEDKDNNQYNEEDQENDTNNQYITEDEDSINPNITNEQSATVDTRQINFMVINNNDKYKK